MKAACRTGVELPTVAVQYENLNIGATVHVGGRALPSVLNAYRNAIEVCPTVQFLQSISGVGELKDCSRRKESTVPGCDRRAPVVIFITCLSLSEDVTSAFRVMFPPLIVLVMI